MCRNKYRGAVAPRGPLGPPVEMSLIAVGAKFQLDAIMPVILIRDMGKMKQILISVINRPDLYLDRADPDLDRAERAPGDIIIPGTLAHG